MLSRPGYAARAAARMRAAGGCPRRSRVDDLLATMTLPTVSASMSSRVPRPWPALARAVSVAAGAWALLAWPAVASAQPASAPQSAAAAASAVASQVAAVQTRRWADAALRPERDAAASVVPRNESKIAAEVGGRLLRWTVDVGATVPRGALLAEIDATDLRLARDRARAALQTVEARRGFAEAQLKRARDLVAQGFFSAEAVNQRETELRLADTELASARSQLALAERQLAYTRITAPFAATVKQRLAQAGEVVAPGTPLYVLVERGGAEVSAALAPADAHSLRAARGWTFVDVQGRHALRLARVAGTVTVPARTVEVRLAFTGAEAVPGSQGRLLWQDPRPHVGPELVVRRSLGGRSQLGVFVVEGGHARFVELPAAEEGRAAIADLPAEAQLVVQGHAALSPGQAVQASPAR